MFTTTHTKKLLAVFAGIMIACAGIIAVYTPRVGLEFTGGSMTEVRYTHTPSLADIRSDIDALTFAEPLESYTVRAVGFQDGASGVSVRTRHLEESDRILLHTALIARDASSTIARYTTVGPVIGQELADKAWWAIAAIALSIVGYVAYAFRTTIGPVRGSIYGVVTIVTLLHDLAVPTATLALLSHGIGAEIDILFVIALLAILGYSVNDTIVIFDRVREEIARDAQTGGIRSFAKIVSDATRLSLGRSINTSMTVALSLVALYFYGSSATSVFALVLLAGVVAGTYSSLYIANPLLIVLADKFPRKDTASAE